MASDFIDEDKIDNWEIVELGFSATGERIAKALTDQAKKGYILSAVEDYMGEYETISNFFNVKGERARVVAQPANHRFEVSNYKLDDATKPVVNGQVAHWDISDRKFVISNGGAVNAEYATAGNKYIVVDAVGNTLGGQATIRFEIAE